MAEINPTWDKALEAFQAGEIGAARRLLAQVVESDPENTEALHMLSVMAHSEHDLALHEQYLMRILAINPNHVRSMTALSNLLRERGQVPEAMDLAGQATKIAPRYANAYNALGLCYNELGEWRNAADTFTKAAALQPEAAPIYAHLGFALQGLGDSNKAMEAYKTAIKLDPSNSEPYEALGLIYSEKNRRAQALRCYQTALRLHPDSVRYLLLVAKLLQFYGRTEESISLVKRALDVDPESAEAHLSYGYLMQDLGEFEEAKRATRRSIELAPVQGKAYLALISAAKIKGSDRALLRTIDEIIASEDANKEEMSLLHLALGKGYADLAEYEKAVSHVDDANRIFIEANGGTTPFKREGFEEFADRMIETLSPQFFAEQTGSGSDSDLPVFIIGLPRSGTTLTEQILSCHPQVSPAGELSFWADLDAEESLANLAPIKGRRQEVAKAYLQLLRSIGPDSRFVTDKRPDNFCFAGFMHLLFPKARFIHCRRELIDNALSLYLTPFRSHAPFTYSREDIVFYIRQYQRLMNHWRKVIPAHLILDVDYEDVVGDLGAGARRITEFLGLPWNDACLHPEQNRRVVSTPSNWQTRQAVYQTSVNKWRLYEPWLGELRLLLRSTE